MNIPLLWGETLDPPVRSSQVDAGLLDGEIEGIFLRQFNDALELTEPRRRRRIVKLLNFGLKVVLWKFAMWDNDTTPGSMIQNLKLVGSSGINQSPGVADYEAGNAAPSPRQKLAFFLCFVLARAMYDLVGEKAQNGNWLESEQKLKKIIYKTMGRLDSGLSVLGLLNYIDFLRTGRYVSFPFRMLSLRMVPASRSLYRDINFEFQDRQLIWSTITEFLLFVVPLLRLSKVKRKLQQFSRAAQGESDDTKGSSMFSSLPSNLCAISVSELDPLSMANNPQSVYECLAHNPYQADCGCIYAYVNITAKLVEAEGDGWQCLRCGRVIHQASRWISRTEAQESILQREATEETESEYNDSESSDSSMDEGK